MGTMGARVLPCLAGSLAINLELKLNLIISILVPAAEGVQDGTREEELSCLNQSVSTVEGSNILSPMEPYTGWDKRHSQCPWCPQHPQPWHLQHWENRPRTHEGLEQL